MCRIHVLYAKTVKHSLLLIISLNNIPLTFHYPSLYPHYIPIDIPFSTISPLSHHIVGKMNHARAKQLREELVLLLRFHWGGQQTGKIWGDTGEVCYGDVTLYGVFDWCTLMYIDVYWCNTIDVYWGILMYIDDYWCILYMGVYGKWMIWMEMIHNHPQNDMWASEKRGYPPICGNSIGEHDDQSSKMLPSFCETYLPSRL